MDYEDTVFQSLATYSCNKGFEISGDETRVCNVDGSWLGTMPSCKRKSQKLYPIELTRRFINVAVVCEDLDSPLNGEVTYKDVVFNSIATYSCQYGYQLVGESTRVCKEDTKWSGEEPTCESQ